MKITKQDFDNAVKQRWNAHTCILAQFAIRASGLSSARDIKRAVNNLSFENGRARRVMFKFDLSFLAPGDENKPELQALRASLPITI